MKLVEFDKLLTEVESDISGLQQKQFKFPLFFSPKFWLILLIIIMLVDFIYIIGGVLMLVM